MYKEGHQHQIKFDIPGEILKMISKGKTLWFFVFNSHLSKILLFINIHLKRVNKLDLSAIFTQM